MSDQDDDTSLPILSLLQLHFANDSNAQLALVRTHRMVAYADWRQLKLTDDERASMQKENDAELKTLDAAVEDAQTNFGDSEVREALLKRAKFHLRVGDKAKSIAAYRETEAKTVGAGPKLELALTLVRVGFFFEDAALVADSVQKAKVLVEKGGDWDRRNRLKVYEATHLIAQRRFDTAAALLLETLSTYNANEVLPFDDFVRIASLCALLHLDRQQLREKVAQAPELVKPRANGDPTCRAVDALLDGSYRAYFEALVDMHAEHRRSVTLAPHAAFCLRELRVRGYKQLLQSYRSVKLDVMARAFGITTDFLDRELARFIALGRLPCKIDKVNGVVEMQRPDAKAESYAQSLKQGDALLNRVQKLARVINM